MTPATVQALEQKWRAQADECDREADRLEEGGIPTANEIRRDGAQYRQCADQLAALSQQLAAGEGAVRAWEVFMDGSSSVTSDAKMVEHWRAEGCRIVPLAPVAAPGVEGAQKLVDEIRRSLRCNRPESEVEYAWSALLTRAAAALAAQPQEGAK